MDFVDDCIIDSKEQDLSTQFLQMRKNQLFDLEKHFECYCNVLPVFGFNSAKKKDINLIKSNLLPIPVDDQEIEPAVMKKAHQFVSFNIGDSQLLDIMNFLGGATKLDFFSKLTRLMRQKGFSRKNGSIAKRN